MKDYADLIDDYISGDLDPELEQEFESAREKDPELNKLYQVLKKGRTYLKARELIEEIENDPEGRIAEELVNEFYQNEKAKVNKSARRRLRLFICLMAILFIIVLVSVMTAFRQKDPLNALFLHYYAPLQIANIHNDLIHSQKNNHYIAGLRFYTEGDYFHAIEQFRQAEHASFYLGLSYLGAKDYVQSRIHLWAFYYAQPRHPGVNWYLGLTYLKLEDPDKALEHFSMLLPEGNPYRNCASRIIRKLQRLSTQAD